MTEGERRSYRLQVSAQADQLQGEVCVEVEDLEINHLQNCPYDTEMGMYVSVCVYRFEVLSGLILHTESVTPGVFW